MQYESECHAQVLGLGSGPRCLSTVGSGLDVNQFKISIKHCST